MNEPLTQSVEAQDPLVGTTLDEKFEIKELLGTGATGRVYRARHLILDRDVAVKLLHDHLSNDDEIRKRFKREYITGGVLEHPFIAKVFSASAATNKDLYLVMDYIDGQPLSSMLAIGPLQVEQFFKIFACLLSALQYAHAAGVVHRDIKPGNVIVSNDTESAYIVDFGIAKIINPERASNQTLTATGTIQGTSSYMSPEQCIGKHVDARSDIYSLGCVMYEALTGQPPYHGESTYDVMYKHLNDSVSKLKHLDKMPASVAALISRCLQKNVLERYQDIEALRQDFEKCKRERPTEQSDKSQPKMPGVVVCSATILGLALMAAVSLPHFQNTKPKLDLPRASIRSQVVLGSQHLHLLCTNECKKNSFATVIALCEDWFAKNPNATMDIDCLNSRLMQAESYVALKQPEKGKPLFRLIIEHKKATAVLKAEALCWLAKVETSKSKSTLLSLARQLDAIVEVLDGEKTYEQAANSQARCLKTIGELHLRCDDQKMAETYLIKAIKFGETQSMDVSDPILSLVDIYSNQDRKVEAQQWLLKAMHSPNINPQTAANSLESIAKSFTKINDKSHAEEAYKLAIKRAGHPREAFDAALVYAAFLNDQKRFAESRKQYSNLLLSPNIPQDTQNSEALLYAFIATSFLSEGRPKDASDSLRKSLISLLSQEMNRIDRKQFDDGLRRYLSLELGLEQRRTQCRTFFQGLLTKAKDPITRGIIYLRLADIENQITSRQASQYFQLALNNILSSGEDKASGALAAEACSQLVDCARVDGDKATAVAALERTTQWCEDNGFWSPYLDLTIIWSCLEDATNNKAKAAALLDALSNKLPRPSPTRLSEVLIRLCHMYNELGEIDKAKQCLERATKVISTIKVAPIAAERHCESLQAALLIEPDEPKRNKIYQQLHTAVISLEQMPSPPVSPLALAALELRLATHFRDTGEKQTSMEIMNKASNRLKDNYASRADLQVLKARWLCEDQRIKQGIILLEDALRQLPDSKDLPAAKATDIQLGRVRLQNQLTEFYVKENRIEESKKLFTQCLASADALDKTESAVFRLNFAAALLTAGVEKTLAEQLLRTALPVLQAGGARTATHLSRANSLLLESAP